MKILTKVLICLSFIWIIFGVSVGEYQRDRIHNVRDRKGSEGMPYVCDDFDQFVKNINSIYRCLKQKWDPVDNPKCCDIVCPPDYYCYFNERECCFYLDILNKIEALVGIGTSILRF